MDKINFNITKSFARIALYYAGFMSVILIYAWGSATITNSPLAMLIHELIKMAYFITITLPCSVIGLLALLYVFGWVTINGKEFNDEL